MEDHEYKEHLRKLRAKALNTREAVYKKNLDRWEAEELYIQLQSIREELDALRSMKEEKA